MARTFRQHFKRYQPEDRNKKLFIKENFDVFPYCNSRFTSTQQNILARLQNCLTGTINGVKSGLLPKYIVVVLDDNVISYLDYKGEGTSTLLGTYVEWLTKEFDSLIQKCLEQVPLKSRI